MARAKQPSDGMVLKPIEKVEVAKLKANVTTETLARAQAYGEFLNADLDYVVQGALEYAMTRDKKFCTWLKDHPPAPVAAAE
jgi:hypothetical protein